MAHPKKDQEYLFNTDECDYAVGATLCQKDVKGFKRSIAYSSKQLSSQEPKWAAIETETYKYSCLCT